MFGFIKKIYGTAVVGLGKPLINPLRKLIGKKPKKLGSVVQEREKFLGTKGGKVLSTAFVGTTVALAAVTAPTWAKAAIPKSFGGKVALGTVAYLGVTSEKARKVITSTPERALDSLDVVSNVIESDKKITSENIGDIAKVVGLITGVGAVAVGAGYVGKKILERKEKTIKKILGREEKPITVATPEIPKETNHVEQLVKEKPLGIQGETPITPQTTTISTGKRTYKRRRATKQQPVRQSVRVNVINRSTSTGVRNTTYLKERLLA